MEKLNLIFVKQKLEIESPEKMRDEILNTLKEIDKIYSYILFAHYDNDILSYYDMNYRICDDNKYNTIESKSIPESVLKQIKNPKGKRIVGYKQAPLEVLIETFDPLIYKLALVESLRWKRLEFDDLYQMCRLTMCNLYNKGYYIHKRLLAKSFDNDVLMEMRKHINEPEIISIYDRCGDTDSDERELRIIDTVEDTSYRTDEEEREEQDIRLSIFGEVKDIIIDMIGIRRYEQLARDYKNKTTSNTTRKEMFQIRKKFEKEGLDRKEFLKRYGKR